MPPAVITNVIPMLITPMIEANRMMVRKFSKFENRSPAVIAPTATIRSRAMTSPRLRPTLPPRNRRIGLTGVSWVMTAGVPAGTVLSEAVGSLTRRFLP
jgi:hypothetical protein